MAIKLNNFVDININYNATRNANYTRDTAVLIINGSEDSDGTYKTLEEVLEFFIYNRETPDERFAEEGELRYYVEEFFNNRGAKLRIIVKQTANDEPKYVIVKSSDFQAKAYYQKNASSFAEVKPSDLKIFKYVSEEEKYESSTVNFEETSYFNLTKMKSEELTEQQFEMGVYYTIADEGKTYTHATEWTEGTVYYSFEPVEVSPTDYDLYQSVITYKEIPLKTLSDIVTSLDNIYIVICSNQKASTIKNLNNMINKPVDPDDNLKGIESKLFLSCIDATNVEVKDIPSELYTKNYNGLILKYGTLGSEMSIAAYLTNINVFAANSIKDYDFSIEKIDYTYTNSGNEVVEVKGTLVDDDTDAKTLLKTNINFNGELVGEVRALGGNDTNGNDFVNEFMLILLHQTLTEQLVNLLTSKIKYNSTGLSLIGATIARELQKYVTNGYLTTDKTWDDEDLVYNGITIITKNTPLKIGYKYVVMPFSTLSVEERKDHKLPTIYILIADSYSIRKITIEGTVF